MCQVTEVYGKVMVSFSLIIAVWFVVLCAVGCTSKPTPIHANLQPLDRELTFIKNSANTILSETKGEKRIPVIHGEALHIRTSAEQAEIITQNASVTFEDIQNKLNESQKNIDLLNKQIEESKDAHTRRIKSMWLYISAISALVTIAGITFIVFGVRAFGASLVGIGIITIALSYAMIQFATVIAICALILILAIICYSGYLLIKYRKTIKELVVSGEIMKNKEWNDETKQEINEIQSNETKLIVAEEKIMNK